MRIKGGKMFRDSGLGLTTIPNHSDFTGFGLFLSTT